MTITRRQLVQAMLRLACLAVIAFAAGITRGAEPVVVRIQPHGGSDSMAIKQALASLQPGQTLLFTKGAYQLDAVVWLEQARDLRLLGEPGAVIQKTGRFQFLFAFIASTNVTIEGLTFEGGTKDRAAVAWGEEGVYFGSCHRSTVKACRFFNFGDSAVRMTTSLAKGGTDSADGRILDCYFENVTQITTNQGMDGPYGGTSGMLIQGNVFENLKGSIKIAARAPTSGCRIIGNHVRSSRRDGIQVESVSDVQIEDNTLEQIARVAVILNVNDNGPKDAPGFAWDNVALRHNRFQQCGSGIQVYLKPCPDGSQFDMADLNIVGNHFENITDPNSDAVIWLGNTTRKTFLRPVIAENEFKNTPKLEPVKYPVGMARAGVPP